MYNRALLPFTDFGRWRGLPVFRFAADFAAAPRMRQREPGPCPNHIERETAKLDNLAAKYRRELELLAEYRASLISHAVTGKIDVRGLVSPVTEESP